MILFQVIKNQKKNQCEPTLSFQIYANQILTDVTPLEGKTWRYHPFLKNGLFEIHNIQTRHNDIVKEMENRGYNHNSPLPTFTEFVAGNIDSESNKTELFKRCEGCRKRYEKTEGAKTAVA